MLIDILFAGIIGLIVATLGASVIETKQVSNIMQKMASNKGSTSFNNEKDNPLV